MFIGGIAYNSIVSFLNAYAIELGAVHVASFFFIVYAAFLFVGRPAAGRLYDRRGENIVVIPSLLCFAACFGLLVAARGGLLLLLPAVFMAFGYGTLMPTFQNVVVRVSPKGQMGMAITTYYIFLDVGNSVGGYFIGWLIDGFGFRVMYAVVALMVLAAVPVYWIGHGRRYAAGR
jgi:MFS family permease